MNPKKISQKKQSIGSPTTSYLDGQANKSESTKKNSSASEKKGSRSPTTGVASQGKHPTSSHGKKKGPSSIARKDFAKGKHLDELLRAIDSLAGKHGLATGVDGIVPAKHLSLPDTERKTLLDAIVLMASRQEFTVARRLLSLGDTGTRAALLQALPPDCLEAMLSNPVAREKRLFVQLIHTTAERAIAKGQSESARPLLDMLPPFDRAKVLLSLSDAQPAPQPLLAGKAPEVLTRTVAMSDECWGLLTTLLEEVASIVADKEGLPVLELGPKLIRVSRPLPAGRDVSLAFSQAIAYLLEQGHALQACQLLSMCEPLACAYVLQSLEGQSPTGAKRLAEHALPPVAHLFGQAVAGCLAHMGDMKQDDLNRLQHTLKQLEAYDQKPATIGASAERASGFWQAYAACSDAERKDLRWRVPAAFPSRQAEGIRPGQLPSDVSQDIDDAFAVRPETGLQACEAWLGQLPTLTPNHPAKALALAWAVVCALETQAPSGQWTEAQRNWRARLIERPLEQPLVAWTLAVLPGVPQVDQEDVLAALVEQAANVPAPRCVNLLAQWVDVHARLLSTEPRGSAASAQCLRQYLIEGLTSLLNQLEPFGGDELRLPMKALMTRLSGGAVKCFNKALVGGRLEEAADWVGEMFQSGDPEAGDCFKNLMTNIKETLKEVDLAFGVGDEGLSVVSTEAPQGEAVPFVISSLSQRQVAIERAFMCLQSCGNADVEPFLPALRRWLKANPLDESLLTGNDRDKIEAYRVRARVAEQSLITWRPGGASLHQARRWLGALDILGREHTEQEAQSVLDELSRPEFGQWMDAAMQTKEGPAEIERVLFELMLSPHVDEQTLRWLVGRHAHRMNLSAALSRAPQPNAQGRGRPTGVEGLLSLVEALVRFPRVLQMEIDTSGPGGADWRELMNLSRWLSTHYRDPLQPTGDEMPFAGYVGDHEGLVKKVWSTSLVHGLPCPDWIHQGYFLAKQMHRDTFLLWDDKALDAFAQDLASAQGLGTKAVWPKLLHHLMMAITSSSTTIDAFAKRARGRLYSLADAQTNQSFELDPSWAVASVTVFRARLDQHKARGATVIDQQLLSGAVALVAVWLAATRQHPGWTAALNKDDRHWVEGLVKLAQEMEWSTPTVHGQDRLRLEEFATQWFDSFVKADH